MATRCMPAERRLTRLGLVGMACVSALVALPAHARFGKGGSHSSSSGSSGSHGSGSSSTTHGSAPVHTGSNPTSGGRGTGQGTWYTPDIRVSPWAYGYYSGYYVPRYGYGYGTWVTGGAATVAREESTIRITAGIEGQVYVTGDPGVTLGLNASFEGEQFGVTLTGQNIAVKNQEGPGFDTIQQMQARITWAFLSGKYGRLRAELGGDGLFAQNLTVIAPTGGFSGTVWVGGPVAIEGSVLVTPWPITQIDYRAGLALGLGGFGLRAGWRTQVLDDRGVVDGEVHRDVFMGPYIGASIVF